MKSKQINSTLGSVSLLLASLVLAADHPTGSPNQQAELDWLSMPSDVAIGSGGKTYVVDGGNHQVAVFDAAGAKITALGMMGSEEGQFLSPLGIGASAKGEIYCSTCHNQHGFMSDSADRQPEHRLRADDICQACHDK